MQGVGGDDAAVEPQERQGLPRAQRLVATGRKALADHQPRLGRPDIDQVQRRRLASPLISPAQRLAVDRNHARQRPGEGPRELCKRRLERLRLQKTEHPAEGVVAHRQGYGLLLESAPARPCARMSLNPIP